jgi:hypothetical protein
MVWHWLGVFTASSGDAGAPPRPAAPDVQAAAARAVAASLFGQPGAGGAGATVAAGNIRLKGVFAGASGLQAAIVNTGKDDSFVALSGEIAPGVVLQEVHSTHIVVTRNGLAQRVELDVLKSPEGGGAARRREAREPEPPSAPQREEAAEVSPGAQPAADAPVPQAVPGGPVPVPIPGAAPAVPVPAPQSGAPGTHEQGYA